MSSIGEGREGGGVGGGSLDLWAFYMVALSGMLLVVFEICAAEQEGVGSITFGVKSIKKPLVESCRLIYVWANRRGGGGEPSFLKPPSKNLLGHSYKILNTSAKSSAQAQSIGTLFEQIG